MRASWIVPRWTGFLLGVASCVSIADAEPYARICVTTLDASSKESVLLENSAPGPGTKLVVHLDASVECAALEVPLVEKSSRLANGWRPQIISLPEWNEDTLPDSRTVWDWNKTGDPFELWIFFFKRDAAGLEEIQKLVAAMQSPAVSEQLLAQQTRKLCEKLSSRMSGKALISQGPKADPDLVGGAMRGADFPWRIYADKVALNNAFEGELVLRHGR